MVKQPLQERSIHTDNPRAVVLGGTSASQPHQNEGTRALLSTNPRHLEGDDVHYPCQHRIDFYESQALVPIVCSFLMLAIPPKCC